jgi:ectoine hydroxylase-related dioxygenase (phytanoyl-CoA dioxygenase family)
MLSESFAALGFVHVPGVLAPAECEQLAQQASAVAGGSAGTRALLKQPWCLPLVEHMRAHAALSALLPRRHVAVQCTYFEKSRERNWLVPAHQDLSIPVAQRVSHPELRGWATKEGSLFVQAPAPLLSDLVAVRVHLDACTNADGPLRVVPGSHLWGIVAPDAAGQSRSAEIVCPAEQGAALVMHPLLLHASSKTSGSGLRRVLHLLFGPPELPFGLEWQHAV